MPEISGGYGGPVDDTPPDYYPDDGGGPSGSGGTSGVHGDTGSGGGIITPFIIVPAAPIAQFDYELHHSGIVKFTNTTLNDAKIFLWNFGDGSTSSARHPYHVYANAGTYPVRLTAQNAGGTDIAEQSVVVTIDPKELDFSYTVSGFTVQFEFGGNYDAGDILWTFDDGTTSTEKDPRHIFYAGNGSYNVVLTAGGLSKTYTVAIAVGILLEWQDNSSDETGFKIEHATNPAGSWTQIATVGAGVEQFGINNGDFGINTDEMNYFRVRAYSGAGNSGYTNTAAVQCSQV